MRGKTDRLSAGILGLTIALVAGCNSGYSSGNGGDAEGDDPDQLDRPGIAWIDPASGNYVGGEVVTLYTAGFQDDFLMHWPTVFFGSEQAAITSVSSFTVEAVTPTNVRGAVDVEVRATGVSESAILEQGYTYYDYGDPPPFGGPCSSPPAFKIVFCVDRSEGMGAWAGAFVGPDGQVREGTWWDRAVAEVSISLTQLTPNVEFGIVTYGCDIDLFRPDLVAADVSEIIAALDWLQNQSPAGDTGTGPAQAAAFRLADGGEVGIGVCYLLSHGLPECGADGWQAHKALALSANTMGHPLHAVGLGDESDAAVFLREMAAATGGTYLHVQ
ncbi:MAG: hypothetical protein O7H41_05080 [Planctomycetota bacterium]|nr:hypothetical protein [Planctomycetota bacterium]